MWGISILADFRPSFHAVVVFGLGKNLSFKSVLGHCVLIALFSRDFTCYLNSRSWSDKNDK